MPVEKIKCHSCGTPLIYEPGQEIAVCKHCAASNRITQKIQVDEDAIWKKLNLLAARDDALLNKKIYWENQISEINKTVLAWNAREWAFIALGAFCCLAGIGLMFKVIFNSNYWLIGVILPVSVAGGLACFYYVSRAIETRKAAFIAPLLAEAAQKRQQELREIKSDYDRQIAKIKIPVSKTSLLRLRTKLGDSFKAEVKRLLLDDQKFNAVRLISEKAKVGLEVALAHINTVEKNLQ